MQHRPCLQRRGLATDTGATAAACLAARVDLDGTPCGEVTAADQEHASARLTEIQAAREAKRAAAAAGARTAKQAAAVAPVSVTKVSTLKAKPVLHLPAINR